MRRRILQASVTGAVLSTALVAWSAASARFTEETPVAVPIIVSKAYVESTDRLRRNETLSHMLARHNIEGVQLLQLLEVARPDGLSPRRITRRQTFDFRYVVGEDVPDRITTRISDDAYLRLDRDSAMGWASSLDEIQWLVYRETVSGTIEASLNDAIHAAVPDSILSYAHRDRLVWNVAEDVFGWVINFWRDIRPGDEFHLFYERLVSSAGDVRYGRLLAGRIETAGRANTAYVMPDAQNRNIYYDADGRSLRRAFLRYPVQFRRISGGFGRRYHPILRRYRAHLGTDYAADSGTPIYATADGVVERAGRWGGYGNIVTVRHASPQGGGGFIETRYAHMIRIARDIKPGTRVTQGQIIGYVGMTGLATGPHVHYEFLRNDRQVNPRGVDMGDGEPIPNELRDDFEVVRVAYDRTLHGPNNNDGSLVARRQ